MQYKGIVFDFNGVLWWDTVIQEKVWRDFAVKLRKEPVTDEEMLNLHGRPNQYVLSYLTGREIVGQELLDMIQGKESAYRSACLALRENFKLSPGSTELLDYLQRYKIPHTIATASEKTNVDFFIKNLKLDKWFDISNIVYDDGNLPGKPAPDIYLRAASNIGVTPSDCIVVEDAHSGIKAAFAAGIGYIVALGPEERRVELSNLEGVARVITDLSELNFSLFKLS